MEYLESWNIFDPNLTVSKRYYSNMEIQFISVFPRITSFSDCKIKCYSMVTSSKLISLVNSTYAIYEKAIVIT